MMQPDFVFSRLRLFAVLFTPACAGEDRSSAMSMVGIVGLRYPGGRWNPAHQLFCHLPIPHRFTDYSLGLIPSSSHGCRASASGHSTRLYRAANAFMGHRKGGLAMATITACGGFSAISGSSVATAATMSKVGTAGNAPLRLSRFARHRHDRGRRHTRHPHPAVDRARHLRRSHRHRHRPPVHSRRRCLAYSPS